MPEEMSLTVFNQFETQIAALEEANAELDFDVNTEEGESDCRKWHATLRKGWNAVEQEIIDAILITTGDVTENFAQSVVDAIVTGEIPNVKIIY